MSRLTIIILAGLVAFTTLIGMVSLSLKTIDGMIDKAAASARAERDHYWRAEIEQSNAATQVKIAENLKLTMAVQETARDQVAAAEARSQQLETENATLPDDGTCGLGRARVRLLNQR